MPALPIDIAKFTTNGVLITAPDEATQDAIKAQHPDAQDGLSEEIESFCADADDAQILLDERAEYLTVANPVHLGIEVEDGSSLPLFSDENVATYACQSEYGTVDCRLRAIVIDTTSDRYSFEVLQ